MKMTKPELKVVRFASEDVIATSGYYIESANWMGNNSYSDPYVHFYGEMGEYSSGAQGWIIYGVGGDSGESSEYRESYINDIATSNPSTAQALGGHLYDAYYYDGNYYTKGASYYELYNNQ